MLYKKSKFGRKYVQLITGSPTIFISFILIGLGLFIILTCTTKIDHITKHSAEVVYELDEVGLKVDDSNVSNGLVYIYLNKNEAVYPVSIIGTETFKDHVILQFNSEEQQIIKSLSAESIYIDIPQGEYTLLYHIFVNGGNRNE